jgi:CheY-like chemotaxis protein
MSELIGDLSLGPLNERQAEGMHNINESGRHLLDLINDILDLSKIEAGMLELHFESMDVASFCQSSVRFILETARRKELTVQTNLHHHTPCVLADERRLKQVLVNLLANAVKFTPAGGRVGLDVHEADGQLRFEVWDTGIGIDAKDFDRLFQPFQQIDSSLSRQYAGTGLGLALVRRMTQLHGGSVTLQSETGRGSRFIISIPLVPADTDEPEDEGSASALPVIASQTRILLAEDNEANHAVYRAFFAQRGCELLLARNGREAVDLTIQHQPDLVLMDIQMPVMDGLEAIRLLRGDARTEQLPIIAITALAMPGDRVRCLEAGANAYLTKPINMRELARLIARYTTPTPAEPTSAT